MTREERRILYFLVTSLLLGSVILLVVKRSRPDPVRLAFMDPEGDPVPVQAGPHSLNTATEEELICVPGIGPVLARRIVEQRERIGGFSTLDELRLVKGIGEKKLQQIEPYLSLDAENGGDR
jgi:competence protein ComEA